MRCGQNGMDARHEVQPIVVLLASRVTPRTPVRPRRAEQGPAKRGAGPHLQVGCARVAGHRASTPASRALPANGAPALRFDAPSACRWRRPRRGMLRTFEGAVSRVPSRSHRRKRGLCSALRCAPQPFGMGGCDAVRAAPVREQTHKPRPTLLAAAEMRPCPLRDSESGAQFRPRRCCSLLVWAGQTASLAPSRERNSSHRTRERL